MCKVAAVIEEYSNLWMGLRSNTKHKCKVESGRGVQYGCNTGKATAHTPVAGALYNQNDTTVGLHIH